jgi:histidinol phosphatase-like enzyme
MKADSSSPSIADNVSHIVLICADRDGTVNKDEDYFLGSQPQWKEQVKFLPGVIEGIRLLNVIPNSKFVLTTNQSGVALEGPDFELLTEERAKEVNEYIVSVLNDHGCHVDSYRFCPYVTSVYAAKATLKGYRVAERYINDHARCLKPNIGMLEDAAEQYGERLSGIPHKFMIGDRASDIETGLRAECVSFFVPSLENQKKSDFEKVMEAQRRSPGKVFIVGNLLEAAQQIKRIVNG